MNFVARFVRRGLLVLTLAVMIAPLSGCGYLLAGALVGAGAAMQESAERAQ